MDLQVDTYLSRKARAVWPWAIVREERDGSWVLFLSPGDVGRVLVTGGPVDPAHPRARFHAARRRLYELRDAHRTSATGRGAR